MLQLILANSCIPTREDDSYVTDMYVHVYWDCLKEATITKHAIDYISSAALFILD